ncbi:MAG: hypothetical protein HQL00_13175 [Nitrospirae bacterium]|nr:hypothetical protein [Nitrospirota bacterium]
MAVSPVGGYQASSSYNGKMLSFGVKPEGNANRSRAAGANVAAGSARGLSGSGGASGSSGSISRTARAVNDQKVQQEVQQLKQREQQVRTHEQAHQSVGGRYAGAPTYQYTKGPDGKSYITGGEVSIDVSKAKTPEDTVKKMEQVRAAALAPSDPSPQDQSVAQKASQIELQAEQEIARFAGSGVKSAYSANTETAVQSLISIYA